MTLRMQILFMTISLVQISCEWETKQMCVSNVHPSLHHYCLSSDVMKDGRLRHTFVSSPPSFKYGLSYAISSNTELKNSALT